MVVPRQFGGYSTGSHGELLLPPTLPEVVDRLQHQADQGASSDAERALAAELIRRQVLLHPQPKKT